MTRTVCVLTDEEMIDTLHEIVAADDDVEALVVAIKEVWAILLAPTGKTLDDYGPENQIDPTQFAIPKDQWITIAQALADKGQGDLARVNVALDWMNVGPSTMTEEEMDEWRRSPATRSEGTRTD